MIRLGIIILILVVFFFAFRWFHRNVVTPNLHQKHLRQLEKENVELDRTLDELKRKSTFNDPKKGE